MEHTVSIDRSLRIRNRTFHMLYSKWGSVPVCMFPPSPGQGTQASFSYKRCGLSAFSSPSPWKSAGVQDKHVGELTFPTHSNSPQPMIHGSACRNTPPPLLLGGWSSSGVHVYSGS